MIINEDDYLEHYGILRKSGRYPWGSGETPAERGQTFIGTVADLRKKGLSDAEIARGFGMTTTQFRETTTMARNAKKLADISMAQRLKDKGMSNVAIGKRMGIPESSVRALLKPGEEDKAKVVDATSSVLRNQVAERKYLDIGKGAEYQMGITRKKLDTAVSVLKDEGYSVHYVPIEQLGTGKKTTIKVLAGPGVTYGDVFRNRDKIQQIMNYSEDGGRTYLAPQPPLSISSKRVAVRYKEQGGADADGVIYVRPGIEDISLGKARYAQVRVAVDGTHYLKGMAMYRDDLPAGVDLVFNTNKSNTGNKLDAMKSMKDDPTDPFGAIVRQLPKLDANGNPIPNTVRSAMNIVNEEGNWGDWSRSLSSQMLSKQPPKLAEEQLSLAYGRKDREFDEISKLENPVVKQHMLEAFADGVESAAVHLKAAALPRQGSHVILPIDSMKETEVYAPNYRDGELVVLIRYPHGGRFEIPELRVNNRHPEAKKLLGNAPDAIGIHSKVAERLSGADFDGDTVLVIPNNNRSVKNQPPLAGLQNFDPQMYKLSDDSPIPRMTPRTKGIQMGLVSNLITDMHIQGAPDVEIERAVRHSMVVIDAEKHHLNYRQSAIDNGISQLMKKYQGRATGGASTIISRAGSEIRVPERKLRPASEGGPVDRTTGRKVYVETGATYPDGRLKTVKSKKLAETDDAHTLSSGTPIEKIYADHSNRLKSLANRARKESISTTPIPYSPEARSKYHREVESLDAKLNLALRNAPLERQAQVLGNAVYRQKLADNPEMEEAEKKKLRAKALQEARNRTGARKSQVEITDREWEAIQAGAITTNRLKEILKNADLDRVKQLATPKESLGMTGAKKSQAVSMLRRGYTQAEVADALGVSVSTLKDSLKEVRGL